MKNLSKLYRLINNSRIVCNRAVNTLLCRVLALVSAACEAVDEEMPGANVMMEEEIMLDSAACVHTRRNACEHSPPLKACRVEAAYC